MIIVSIFSKHEDFIELQYNSIIKHVKGDYEYTILNNASDNDQIDRNEKMCEKLGIKCIRINSNQNGSPSHIAGDALNIMLENFKGESIFKIDSDMFFMSDIDLSDLLGNNDIIYIPAFSGTPLKEWMWSGTFGLNTNIIPTPMNCQPSNGFDTFGESRFLLDNPNNRRKKINLYGLQTLDDGVITTSCNNDCVITFNKDGKVIFAEKPDYLTMYDIQVPNLYEKYINIIEYIDKNGFPQPYMLDIITVDNIDTIIHFKSASWESFPGDHTHIKKIALKKLLTDETI